MKLKIGTRKSELARRQVHEVITAIKPYLQYAPEIIGLTSTGDKFAENDLKSLGGKALFCKEINQALASGVVDIAVHSAKDTDQSQAEGIILAAVLRREDPRDVMITNRYPSFAAMPKGSIIGTASPRRGAFVLANYPGLTVKLLRGNVLTRISKLLSGEYDGIILAQAGLHRLGLTIEGCVVDPIDVGTLTPAGGQGIIAVYTRSNDIAVREVCSRINDSKTMKEFMIERKIVEYLGANCFTPLGVYAESIAENIVRIKAQLFSIDGQDVAEESFVGEYSEDVAFNIAITLKKYL